MKKPKLIPPDKDQCQAEKTLSKYAMGGRIGERIRCTNKPVAIIKEKKAKDGLKGSMSVCAECLEVAKGQLGENYFTVIKL